MIKRAIILSCLLMLFLSYESRGITGAEIAIYVGPGTWEDGIIGFEHFLDWKGVTHERVSADDVNSIVLKDYYDGICFPGGDAYYYKLAISEAGLQHIRDLVSSGGAYIGICAGAYFASDSVEWEGGLYDYQLDLFSGKASGAIDAIAPWPEYTMTSIRLNADNPINQFEPSSHVTLYYGGPVFIPHTGVHPDTVATWGDYFDEAAIINFAYGSGRVLFLGPHLENEEDDDRDGTDFAQEFDDQGSEWGLLWTAIDWVLGRPISSPPAENYIGDVNGDRASNSTDALLILSCDVGEDVSDYCPLDCGDVNADGAINSTDALIIISREVGLETPYPVGSAGCPQSVPSCAGCQ